MQSKLGRETENKVHRAKERVTWREIKRETDGLTKRIRKCSRDRRWDGRFVETRVLSVRSWLELVSHSHTADWKSRLRSEMPWDLGSFRWGICRDLVRNLPIMNVKWKAPTSSSQQRHCFLWALVLLVLARCLSVTVLRWQSIASLTGMCRSHKQTFYEWKSLICLSVETIDEKMFFICNRLCRSFLVLSMAVMFFFLILATLCPKVLVFLFVCLFIYYIREHC